MVNLPSDRLTFPAHTGKQGEDAPPPPTPDPTLVHILAGARGKTLNAIALEIQAAGYRNPQPVENWVELVDYPPTTILTDTQGRPWSANGIPREMWDKLAPWHVVYTPPIRDIVNE